MHGIVHIDTLANVTSRAALARLSRMANIRSPMAEIEPLIAKTHRAMVKTISIWRKLSEVDHTIG